MSWEKTEIVPVIIQTKDIGRLIYKTVKSQIVTSPDSNFYTGQEGGRRKPPYAFPPATIENFPANLCKIRICGDFLRF